MSSQETLLYAGYGANSDPFMIEAIIGQAPVFLGSVAIKDVELCVQRMEQTPSVIAEGSPVPLSVRDILEDDGNWGKDSGFETYAIRRKQGSVVIGSLFELTPVQRALIAEWEMIEFGWYAPMEVVVRREDVSEVTAQTEGLGDGQEIDRVVDGQNYPTYLNNPEKMHTIAEKTRQEYYERLAQNT
jgi:hypothetical protein